MEQVLEHQAKENDTNVYKSKRCAALDMAAIVAPLAASDVASSIKTAKSLDDEVNETNEVLAKAILVPDDRIVSVLVMENTTNTVAEVNAVSKPIASVDEAALPVELKAKDEKNMEEVEIAHSVPIASVETKSDVVDVCVRGVVEKVIAATIQKAINIASFRIQDPTLTSDVDDKAVASSTYNVAMLLGHTDTSIVDEKQATVDKACTMNESDKALSVVEVVDGAANEIETTDIDTMGKMDEFSHIALVVNLRKKALIEAEKKVIASLIVNNELTGEMNAAGIVNETIIDVNTPEAEGITTCDVFDLTAPVEVSMGGSTSCDCVSKGFTTTQLDSKLITKEAVEESVTTDGCIAAEEVAFASASKSINEGKSKPDRMCCKGKKPGHNPTLKDSLAEKTAESIASVASSSKELSGVEEATLYSEKTAKDDSTVAVNAITSFDTIATSASLPMKEAATDDIADTSADVPNILNDMASGNSTAVAAAAMSEKPQVERVLDETAVNTAWDWESVAMTSDEIVEKDAERASKASIWVRNALYRYKSTVKLANRATSANQLVAASTAETWTRAPKGEVRVTHNPVCNAFIDDGEDSCAVHRFDTLIAKKVVLDTGMKHLSGWSLTTTDALTGQLPCVMFEEVDNLSDFSSSAELQSKVEATMKATHAHVAGDAEKQLATSSVMDVSESILGVADPFDEAAAKPVAVAVESAASDDGKQAIEDGTIKAVSKMSESKLEPVVYVVEADVQQATETFQASDVQCDRAKAIEITGAVEVENAEVERAVKTVVTEATEDADEDSVAIARVETGKIKAAVGKARVEAPLSFVDTEFVPAKVMGNLVVDEGVTDGKKVFVETGYDPTAGSKAAACDKVSDATEASDSNIDESNIFSAVTEPLSEAIDSSTVDFKATVPDLDEVKPFQEPNEPFHVDTEPINPVATLIGRYEQIAKRNVNNVAPRRSSSQTSSCVPSPSPPSSINVFEATAKRNEAIEMAEKPNEEQVLTLDTDTMKEERAVMVLEAVDEVPLGETSIVGVDVEEALAAVQGSEVLTQGTCPADCSDPFVESKAFATEDNVLESALDETNIPAEIEAETVETEATKEEQTVETAVGMGDLEEKTLVELEVNIERMSADSSTGNETSESGNGASISEMDNGIEAAATLQEPSLTDNGLSTHRTDTNTYVAHSKHDVAIADFTTNETMQSYASMMDKCATFNEMQDDTHSLVTPHTFKDSPIEDIQDDEHEPRIDQVAVISMKTSPTLKADSINATGSVTTLKRNTSQPSLSLTYEILGVTRVRNVIMYHIYQVIGATGERVVAVPKRYSDFKKLVAQLRALNTPLTSNLPEVPKANVMTFLRGRRSKRTIEAREKAFGDLLHYIAKHPDLHDCAIFQSFIANERSGRELLVRK